VRKGSVCVFLVFVGRNGDGGGAGRSSDGCS
jgi:hypothetical protein